MKRFIAILLTVVLMCSLLPVHHAQAAEHNTVTISNEYIEVTVSTENGGYTISTLEGDILKKNDDNKALTHRGLNFDTSFLSFQVDNDPSMEYIFGDVYGTDSTSVSVESDDTGITCTWSVGNMEFVQRIELVSGVTSEQLGTAMITVTVRNKTANSVSVKSRLLMDTQLGEKDFGYYELTRGTPGAGYNVIENEQTFEGANVPADYFVKDSPFEPSVAAFGVNSVIGTDKPYQMTFAHWANIAATRFSYTPNPNINFTNAYNAQKTADSAVALYFDLKTIESGGEASFSTFYGVTANLKNKDNHVLINTTAPTRLEFNDARTDYIGTSGEADGIVRVNTIVSNPMEQGKTYKHLTAVVYPVGFTAQSKTDAGNWVEYTNANPVYREITDFTPGRNITTFFDFKFTPKDNHELGSFVTKIFNTDPEVNELGVYAEEFCVGETTNYIFLPAMNASLPSIGLSSMEPSIAYNDASRYLTLTGFGTSFFKTGLTSIELRGDRNTYTIPNGNMTIANDNKSLSLLVDGYMEPGMYQVYFNWDGSQPDDIPDEFTSSALRVYMSDDDTYRADKYGLLAVLRDVSDYPVYTYKVEVYKDEAAFETANLDPEDVIFTLRGELLEVDDSVKTYRIAGKDKDITINHILNYRGGDFVVTDDSGTVKINMNGKLTTIGANTTVRNGSAAFTLNKNTNYVVPVYDERGEMIEGDDLRSDEEYVELRWDNAMDVLQTIGGFLIDLKYGVLGKMEVDGERYDIISFGGGLDLSFMTPGGARQARANKELSPAWSTTTDAMGQVTEVPPGQERVYSLEAGATVHDVLYGQNGTKTGHLGINMDAHIQMPKIVSFLPNVMGGELSINTIGGYEVGIEGEVKAATFEMNFALVVKSNPSGAPIPDKLYFTVGGFEPGINIDTLGILWITGGGGGFDNLYDTIYGFDGLPPLALLLKVDFDIFKIMTAEADIELSLRSLAVTLGEVELKMISFARFLDEGSISLVWYPNLELSLSADVNFMNTFKGNFALIANKELFEMMMRVAIMVPSVVPVIGGMEIAGVEMGGGTEKLWGTAELLMAKFGFTFYWDTGDFYAGEIRSVLPAAQQMFLDTVAPVHVQTDPETGDLGYFAVGSNLEFITGGTIDPNLTAESLRAMRESGSIRTFGLRDAAEPTVTSNPDKTGYVVDLTPPADYLLMISRVDGQKLADDFESYIKVYNNGEQYNLNFYQSANLVGNLPDNASLTEEQERELKEKAATANANQTESIAYISIPEDKAADPVFSLEFTDGSYEVAVVRINPIAELTDYNAEMQGNQLKVDWQGNTLGTATISVLLSEDENTAGVPVADGIPAGVSSTKLIDLPENMASGEYYVTIVLIDEGNCYDRYQVTAPINITDPNAPASPDGVTLSNAGNYRLKVTIDDTFTKANLKGYYLDVYEDGKLIETGVYFSKEEAEADEILIGGRYDVPILEYDDVEQTYSQAVDDQGNQRYETKGYKPDSTYSVKVRAGNEIDGVFHYSAAVSAADTCVLKDCTPPKVEITAPDAITNNPAADLTFVSNENTFTFTGDQPMKGWLYVDGTAGDSYEFADSLNSVYTQTLTLDDGIHTLEFVAEDEDGNRSITQILVSIDTAPPVILLESPIPGGLIDGDFISIRGAMESDARYTFVVNSAVVGSADRDMSEYFNGSIMEYNIPLTRRALRYSLEIRAVDFAGNTTVKFIELADNSIGDIERVELYWNGSPLGSGKVQLNNVDATTDLRLMGITDTNAVIDLTDSRNTGFIVTSGACVTLSGGSITARDLGNAFIMASFDLGGGNALYDGAAVTVSPLRYDGLDNALMAFSDLKQSDYTAESWSVLQEAVSAAGLIRNMDDISQEIIDSAATTIEDAISALVQATPDEEEPPVYNTPSIGSTGTIYYTITFNSNDGTVVAAQRVERGRTLTPPSDPVREGYSFAGWYTDSAFSNLYDFNTPVNSGFTLYAKWIETDKQVDYKKVTYVSGLPDGTFGPDKLVSRAEVAQMLYNLITTAAGESDLVLPEVFDDVAVDHWANNALAWMVAEGFLQGYDSKLRPNDSLTRMELAAVLHRVAQSLSIFGSETEPDVSFSDLDDGHWAYNDIMALARHGIIRGYPDGTFAAGNTITRAEAVTMIARLFGRGETYGEAKTFPDVPDTHWAYTYIMNAANGG